MCAALLRKDKQDADRLHVANVAERSYLQRLKGPQRAVHVLTPSTVWLFGKRVFANVTE